MEIKTIIFHSELEFRNYVIQHLQRVRKLIVFEDQLDCTIFFYCFTKNETIIAAKEPSSKNFPFFKETYTEIANKHHLNITVNYNQILITKYNNLGRLD